MPDPSQATLQDQLEAAVSSAPGLQHSPHTAVTVAQAGGNPVVRAQVVSHAQTQAGLKEALNSQVPHAQAATGVHPGSFVNESGDVNALKDVGHALGWLVGHVAAGVHEGAHLFQQGSTYATTLGHPEVAETSQGDPLYRQAAGAASNIVNSGLQNYQHEYRYLHDIEARHGFLAATAVGVPMVGAGLVGTAAEGPSGGILAAQAVGYLEGQVAYQDSWQRTANGYQYRDPRTGQLVSFGRDMAGLIGLNPKSGHYSDVSGVLDAVGDLGMDPVQRVAGIASAARDSKYAFNVDNLDKATANPEQYADYWRLMDEGVKGNLRDQKSYWTVLDKRLAPLVPDKTVVGEDGTRFTAKGLGSATTAQEAHDVIRSFVKSKEYLSGRLPTLSSVRMPFNQLRSTAANMDTDFVDRVTAQNRLAGMAVGLASPRKWADRFEALPGTSLDPETLKFSGHAVDFTKDAVPLDVMKMLRYSQSQDVALHFGDDWMAADPAQRILMFRNAVLDSTFGFLGVRLRAGEHAAESYADMLDPQSQKYLGEWLDKHASPFSPDAGGVYGHTLSGTKTPNVLDADTEREIGAGIRLSHRGMGAIPKLTEVKRMAAAINGSRDLFGTVDDFAYQHVTQDFFKPLVLQSIAYAEHISGAEDIPNMLRHGPREFVANALASVKTRLGYKVDERVETPVPEAAKTAADARDATTARFQAYVHTMLGRIPMSQWRLDRMAEIYSSADEGIPDVVAAGENYGPLENQAEKTVRGLRARAARATNFSEGKQYEMMDPTDRRYIRNWKIQLRGLLNDPLQAKALKAYAAKRAAGASEDEATRAAQEAHLEGLRALPPETRAFYSRSKAPAVGHDGVDPLESWSHVAVEDVKALTHSPKTRQPLPIMDDLVRGNTPSLPKLKAIDAIDRPLKMSGRILVPEGTGRIQRIANVGFRKVLNPMVNELSRHPEFASEYMKQYRVLEPMVESGGLRADEAVTIAKARAASETMRFVHNLSDRSQWSETMRNWAPFYFAQEQAYRRMGRLLASDPAAFRKYQLMIANVHDLSVKQQDGEGNSYFALPGAGLLDKTFVGPLSHLIPIANINPVEFGGSWSATNVMFPLSQGTDTDPTGAIRPGWGPVAVVPAKALYALVSNLGKRYSDFAPVAGKTMQLEQGAVGGTAITASMLQEMIPNATIQRLLEATQGYEGQADRSFASAEMMTMQTLQYEQNVAMRKWYDAGQHGEPPAIVPPNNAGYSEKQAFLSRVKNMTFLNYLSRAMIGFVSPVSATVQVNNFGLSTALSDSINKYGVNDGMNRFLLANPDATPYTVAQSIHPETGATLPSSLEGENWITQNASFIKQYPEASMWFMPQLTDNKYNSSVYNEQIADGQRVKLTPQSFLDKLYTAAGDQTYYYNLQFHEANLKAAGGSGSAKSAEYARWDQYITYLQNLMPTWAANSTLFNADRQTASQQTISQMKQILSSKNSPKGKQADGIKALVDSYDTAMQQYMTASSASNYYTLQKTIRGEWTTYLKNMEQSHPELTPVIKSVFSGVLYPQTGG